MSRRPANVNIRNAAHTDNNIQNTSTWLINIGTHKKPINEEEAAVLRDSLQRSLQRVLARPDFEYACFYPVHRTADGRTVRLNGPEYEGMRNPDVLKITRIDADFVVERGTRTGRFDAHILRRVEHEDSRIQVDHNRIGAFLDEELERENQRFREQPLARIYEDGTFEYISWAAPSVYTSFRSVGRSNAADAAVYIRKNTDRAVRPEEQDALRKMDISFISPILAPVGGGGL